MFELIAYTCLFMFLTVLFNMCFVPCFSYQNVCLWYISTDMVIIYTFTLLALGEECICVQLKWKMDVSFVKKISSFNHEWV